jgi:hypothetical protein
LWPSDVCNFFAAETLTGRTNQDIKCVQTENRITDPVLKHRGD